MHSLSLISRLKRAVKKVKILLNLDINRWRLVASLIGASSRHSRRLSFGERSSGLRACIDDNESEFYSPSSSPSFHHELHRTISNQSEDDIDKKAELFIQNFRQQLQIERQISLELKYLQGNSNSFKWRSP